MNSIILAVDTLIGNGSVALWRGNAEIARIEAGVEPPLSEGLLGVVNDICRNSGYTIKDVDELVASIGPGSYTGIRVGVSTCLGIAEGVGCQTVGINTLTALAYASKAGACLTLMNAGGNEFVAQTFDKVGENYIARAGISLLKAEEIREVAIDEVVVDIKTSKMLEKQDFTVSDLNVVSGNGAGLVALAAIGDSRNRNSLNPIYARSFSK